MRLIMLFVLMFSVAIAQRGDTLKNETAKDMICVATYKSVYEEVVQILKPNKSFKKARQGSLVCYNEEAEISSYDNNTTKKINSQVNVEAFKSYLSWQNRFNLTKYENKTRDDVEKEFGIAQRCASYKKGKYCNYAFGLDIYFDQAKKVKKVFLYGNTVNNGKLPFETASIFKLRNNSKPMGLWIQESYKKLFKKEPNLKTNNVIIWNNPSAHIEQVVMTSKNGHFEISRSFKDGENLFRNGRKDSKKAVDYVNAIEVIYNHANK